MPGLIHTVATNLLRFALLFSLFGAGWSIYQRLPHNDPAGDRDPGAAGATMTLRLLLRPAANDPAPVGATAFQLYSVDVAAAERQFDSEARRRFDPEQRVGIRFDDFLTRQMGKRQPVTGQFDERGEATINVPPGKWWVHAELKGAQQNITWRLPVNISGRERVVELTPENSYTRAKSF